MHSRRAPFACTHVYAHTYHPLYSHQSFDQPPPHRNSLCVCVCVCVCACVRVRVRVCVVRVRVCVHSRICGTSRICTPDVCLRACTHPHARTHPHPRTHTHARPHTGRQTIQTRRGPTTHRWGGLKTGEEADGGEGRWAGGRAVGGRVLMANGRGFGPSVTFRPAPRATDGGMSVASPIVHSRRVIAP